IYYTSTTPLLHISSAFPSSPVGPLVRFPLVFAAVLVPGARPAAAQGPRFEVTIPATLRPTPLTGRVYVFISTKKDEEPRLGDHGESNCVRFYGEDGDSLQPGNAARIDAATLG